MIHSLFSFSLIILFVDLCHQISKSVLLAHLVKLFRWDIILALAGSIHKIVLSSLLLLLLVLLKSLLSQSSQFLGNWELLFTLIVLLLLHSLLNDGSWLPQLIFGFNLPGIGIHAHSHIHQISLFILVIPFGVLILSKIVWNLRPRSWRIRIWVLHVIQNILDWISWEHCVVNLFFHCLLHHILLVWIKDIHSFKVEGAYRSHKDFLKILLHHVFVSIIDYLLFLSICAFAS